MIWSVPDIVRYLDDHVITLVYHKGIASLQPQRELKPGVLARVIPHAQARKAELLAYFEGMGQDDPEPKGPTRNDIINAAMKRAIATDKCVWMLGASGMVYRLGDSLLKPGRDDVAGYRWVSVEGDKEWTKLPPES